MNYKANSTFGIRCTTERAIKPDKTYPIPSQEIFEIVKACKKFGVKSIKVDSLGLEVVFSDDVNNNYNNRIKKLTSDQETKLSQVAREEQIRDRELRMSIMDIEDPAAYEQMLISGGEKDFLDAKADDIRS